MEGTRKVAANMAASNQPLRGQELLGDPWHNKGSAFTGPERSALGLRGLLPPRVFTQQEQVDRLLLGLRGEPRALDRYVSLMDLLARNSTLFYRLLVDHLEELMPVVYTPTVGLACQEFGHIFRRAQGLYISSEDRGHVAEILANWPQQDVKVIVVTDGERILGLGDLGAYGMGIPIGKLALYTACAGIRPTQCLPVLLDVGTDNTALLADPFYLGLLQRRERGAAYDALVGEFVAAVQARWPDALLQWEDFGTANAFRLLRQYEDRCCSFNDDIQGTAAVALAGVYSALRITGGRLADQKFLFLGAGEAGLGIGELITGALVAGGLSVEEARRRCWYVDSRGLVVAGRAGLNEHKQPFAHAHAPIDDFADAVDALAPTAIIGVAAMPGRFDRRVLETMGRLNARPIVFALSNPTAKSECTAHEAYQWTEGRAIFASGSPFDAVTLNGRTLRPGQGNNAYIFPGVGLGVVACGLTRVTGSMLAAAARALAEQVSAEDIAEGRIYPRLSRIRAVSVHIAAAVAEVGYANGLAARPRPADLLAHIRAVVYEPGYPAWT